MAFHFQARDLARPNAAPAPKDKRGGRNTREEDYGEKREGARKRIHTVASIRRL